MAPQPTMPARSGPETPSALIDQARPDVWACPDVSALTVVSSLNPSFSVAVRKVSGLSSAQMPEMATQPPENAATAIQLWSGPDSDSAIAGVKPASSRPIIRQIAIPL